MQGDSIHYLQCAGSEILTIKLPTDTTKNRNRREPVGSKAKYCDRALELASKTVKCLKI